MKLIGNIIAAQIIHPGILSATGGLIKGERIFGPGCDRGRTFREQSPGGAITSHGEP